MKLLQFEFLNVCYFRLIRDTSIRILLFQNFIINSLYKNFPGFRYRSTAFNHRIILFCHSNKTATAGKIPIRLKGSISLPMGVPIILKTNRERIEIGPAKPIITIKTVKNQANNFLPGVTFLSEKLFQKRLLFTAFLKLSLLVG